MAKGSGKVNSRYRYTSYWRQREIEIERNQKLQDINGFQKRKLKLKKRSPEVTKLKEFKETRYVTPQFNDDAKYTKEQDKVYDSVVRGKYKDDKPKQKQSSFKPYLYVYDLEDFNGLTGADLLEVYSDRFEYCRTEQAFCELLALIDVLNDNVESYSGWESYLQDEDVVELRVKKLLNAEEVAELDQAFFYKAKTNLLERLWESNDLERLSKNQACMLLSELRYRKKIDKERKSWIAFERSDVINERYPDEYTSVPQSTFDDNSVLSIFHEAPTEKVQVTVKDRSSQQGFRQKLIKFHGSKCMFTGTQNTTVLEACHIIPFAGSQSNILENGLILRVDIHRLFDNFKVAINPNTLKVEISTDLRGDVVYGCLEGIAVTFNPKINLTLFRDCLAKQHDKFLEMKV